MMDEDRRRKMSGWGQDSLYYITALLIPELIGPDVPHRKSLARLPFCTSNREAYDTRGVDRAENGSINDMCTSCSPNKDTISYTRIRFGAELHLTFALMFFGSSD